MGIVGDILGTIAGNLKTILFILAVIAFIAAYVMIKPFADAVGLFLQAVARLFNALVTMFEEAWKKYPQFRVGVLTLVGIVVVCSLIYFIWDAGRSYQKDICDNNNLVLELKRELADEKQRRANAEFERDRNLQANIDAMARLTELELEAQQNQGELDALRKELTGPACRHTDDSYRRLLNIFRGKGAVPDSSSN